MPSVQDATQSTSTDYDPNQDFRSGNSLIHGYLMSKGLAPTSENVRRALEANAREPGMIHNDEARLYNGPAPVPDAVMRRAVGQGPPVPPIPPTGSQPLNIRQPDTSAPPDTRPVIPRPNGPGPLPPDEAAGQPPLTTPPVGGPGPPMNPPIQGNIVPPANLGQLLLSGAPLLGGGGAALGKLLGGPTTPLGIAGPAPVPALGAPPTPLALAPPAGGATPLGIAGPAAPLAITHDPGFNATPRLAAPDPMANINESITKSVPGDVVEAPKAPAAKEEAAPKRARKPSARRLPKKGV